MGQKSSIEWTATINADGSKTPGSTWNPVYGCSMAKGSETGGCLNCYAARLHTRELPGLVAITGRPLARMMASGPRWTGEVGLNDEALTLPLRWRKPRRIFVNSLSYLFHEKLTDEQIDRVFAVMALCPQHTFQCLSKRPERMLAYFGRSARDYKERVYDLCYAMSAVWPRGFTSTWPLPNIWLGVSVENQPTADARIPLLLQTPAAKRFVSYEPALGPVDFGSFLPVRTDGRFHFSDCTCIICYDRRQLCGDGHLDQVIIGGESGPGARPFNIQWARDTIRQCRDAGVACFVKQLGANPWDGGDGDDRPNAGNRLLLLDRKGAYMAEWPSDIRVREFPKEIKDDESKSDPRTIHL